MLPLAAGSPPPAARTLRRQRHLAEQFLEGALLVPGHRARRRRGSRHRPRVPKPRLVRRGRTRARRPLEETPPASATEDVDDVDELAALLSQGGWQTRLVQLTAGPLGFASSGASVPGLSVRFFRYGQGLLFQESLSGPLLNLAFVLDASSPVRMSGSDVGARELVVRSDGDESDYASSRATSSISINVDPVLVGCSDPPRGRVLLPGGDRLRLELLAACRAWVASLRAEGALAQPDLVGAAGRRRQSRGCVRSLGCGHPA